MSANLGCGVGVEPLQQTFHFVVFLVLNGRAPPLVFNNNCELHDLRRGPVCKLHVASPRWLVLALCPIPVVLTGHQMRYVSGVLGTFVEIILVLFQDWNHTQCVRNPCMTARGK